MWQGAFPPPGPFLAGRVSMVVLCAQELQPPASAYPGVAVRHAPFSDHGEPPTRNEIMTAMHAASTVRSALDRGEDVLVTCHMGLNRSGLVSALALMMPHGRRGNFWLSDETPACLTSDQAIALVRRARGEHALGNKWFIRVLAKHDGMCNARPNPIRSGALFV